jgi:tetratricopeptide (TPR) repeat protein
MKPYSDLETRRPDDASGERGRDGFTLNFADGRGVISARDLRVNDAVVIDELELIIAELSFPFDMSDGVGSLMNYRHELGRLSVTVFADGLLSIPANSMRTTPPFRLWNLSFSGDHLVLLFHDEEGGGAGRSTADRSTARRSIALRLVPIVSDGRLEVLVDTPYAFGPVEGNLLGSALSAIENVFGIRLDGLIARIEDLPQRILLQALPQRGWRLPNDEEVRLVEFKLLEDRVTLLYEHRDSILKTGNSPVSVEGEAIRLETVKLKEELRIAEVGDRFALENRTEDARSAYADLLDRDPDNPSAIARAAMVDTAHPEFGKSSLSRAEIALKKFPKRRDLVAVLLQGAALLADTEQEAKLLGDILDNGDGPERLGAGIRLGTLIGQTDPKTAVSVFERVASIFRDDRNAILCLMEAAAKNRDRERVRRLLPRFLAQFTKSEDRAAAHATAGEVMLSLNDLDTALMHFETAHAQDSKNKRAAWGLAETLYRRKDYSRAVERFESLASSLEKAFDLSGSALALTRLADIWMEKDEPSLAVQRLSESLKLVPDQPERRFLLAKASWKMSNIGAAVKELEIVVRQSEAGGNRRLFADAVTMLAGLYLYELDEKEAARAAARRGLQAAEPALGCEEILRRALDRKIAEQDGDRTSFGTVGEVLELAADFIAVRDEKAALRILESGILLFPENVEIEDRLIEYSRKIKDVDRLYKALVSRMETVVSPRRRAEMEIELGNLSLLQKHDATAAACWFKSALDKVPSKEAETGLEAAVKKLKEKSAESRERFPSEQGEVPSPQDGAAFGALSGQDDALRAEQYLARLAGVDLAEHLARRQSPIDPNRLRRAAELFLAEGMAKRAKSVLETLYRETDAIDDLFLLADVLKQLEDFEILIGMLEERRNEDPRVDDRLKEELAMYTQHIRRQSINPNDADSTSLVASQRSTPRTDGMELPMDAPLPDLTEDEESLNEKLSDAFNQLRLK